MQRTRYSILPAVLLVTVLAACNRTETSAPGSADVPAAHVEAAVPASSPPSPPTPEIAQRKAAEQAAGAQSAPAATQHPATENKANATPIPAATQQQPPAGIAGSDNSGVQLKESAKLADAGEEAAPDYQGGDPIAGKTRSELCQGCHGEDGNSLAPLIPKLAGQFSKYITKQIHDYQSGKRKHPIMSAIAATVSDSELADIAAYFASQPRMKGDGEGDSLGQTLFEHGNSSKTLAACIKCHGRNGKGLTPHTSLFPVIGGQRKEYVQKQLMDFRDKIRLNSPGGIMNKITTTLTDAEIEALADYVSAQ